MYPKDKAMILRAAMFVSHQTQKPLMETNKAGGNSSQLPGANKAIVLEYILAPDSGLLTFVWGWQGDCLK